MLNELDFKEEMGELDNLNYAIESASDDLDRLLSYRYVLNNPSSDLNNTSVSLLEVSLESIYDRLGVDYNKKELCNYKDAEEYRNMSLESFSENIARIIRAIKEAIKKVREFILNLLKKFRSAYIDKKNINELYSKINGVNFKEGYLFKNDDLYLDMIAVFKHNSKNKITKKEVEDFLIHSCKIDEFLAGIISLKPAIPRLINSTDTKDKRLNLKELATSIESAFIKFNFYKIKEDPDKKIFNKEVFTKNETKEVVLFINDEGYVNISYEYIEDIVDDNKINPNISFEISNKRNLKELVDSIKYRVSLYRSSNVEKEVEDIYNFILKGMDNLQKAYDDITNSISDQKLLTSDKDSVSTEHDFHKHFTNTKNSLISFQSFVKNYSKDTMVDFRGGINISERYIDLCIKHSKEETTQ